jgi:hypothetical protein
MEACWLCVREGSFPKFAPSLLLTLLLLTAMNMIGASECQRTSAVQ